MVNHNIFRSLTLMSLWCKYTTQIKTKSKWVRTTELAEFYEERTNLCLQLRCTGKHAHARKQACLHKQVVTRTTCNI